MLQQLSDSARAYGHMMSSFCLKLQWPELALVLKQCVNERFESDQPHSFGAEREVNAGAVAVPSRPLAELTRLRPAVANVLYQHGLTNLSKINEASLEDGSCAETVSAALHDCSRGALEETSLTGPMCVSCVCSFALVVSRILRQYRGHVIGAHAEHDDNMEHQAEVGAACGQ